MEYKERHVILAFFIAIILACVISQCNVSEKRTDAQPANGCYKNFVGDYVCP